MVKVLFFFAYNSFGQPYETAKALDSYIQNVKRLTGSDKVNLVPVSLGGSVATAYFDAYKERDDIHCMLNALRLQLVCFGRSTQTAVLF